MSPEFRNKLIEMCPIKESIENKLEFVIGWQRYFEYAQVQEIKQEQEFDSIITARFKAGVISIAAPDCGKEME